MENLIRTIHFPDSTAKHHLTVNHSNVYKNPFWVKHYLQTPNQFTTLNILMYLIFYLIYLTITPYYTLHTQLSNNLSGEWAGTHSRTKHPSPEWEISNSETQKKECSCPAGKISSGQGKSTLSTGTKLPMIKTPLSISTPISILSTQNTSSASWKENTLFSKVGILHLIINTSHGQQSVLQLKHSWSYNIIPIISYLSNYPLNKRRSSHCHWIRPNRTEYGLLWKRMATPFEKEKSHAFFQI